ncbi:transmembrane protein 6/97 [Mortierella sp. GBAus27b]|nr:transmembrane protein 6/97 [Mortierella sp. GBAus27b]
MSVSSARVPLTSRPKDLIMFIYFAIHIPTTALMDIVPLYPAFMTPYIQPLIKFTEYYVETYRDPFIADRSLVWFNTFLHMEGLIQLPIFVYAAWALYHNQRNVALWICIYSAHVMTTVLPCLTTLNFGKDSDFPFLVTDSQKTFLTCLYTPWLLFPLWMLYECYGRVRLYEQGLTVDKKHQ